MDDLRWDDLRTFLAVARQGTLAAAAERLGVNASTVHRRIAALEEALGAPLFDRDPRGYALTAVGEGMLPEAERVEEGVRGVTRAVTGHDRTPEGPVRLTLPESLLGVVAPHLSAFCDAHPRVVPELLVDSRLFDLGHETDVALRASPWPPELALGRRVGTVAWARYAPAHEPADDLPWLAYLGMDHVAAVHWQQRHHGKEPVRFGVSGVTAMHRVLCCSRATGLLPCHLGDPEPRLRRVGSPIPEVAVDLWLLVHADLRRSARVRLLVDFLWDRLAADRPLLEGVA